MIVYDSHFNANEWFIIVSLFSGVACMVLFPKRFSRQAFAVFSMCGVYSGFFFDHSLSVEPVSFYDVNDVSDFEVMDFISYLIYGPFSYFFFYFYDRLQIKPSRIPIYILVWSLTSVGFEGIAVIVGVFHYQHGYKLAYSFPIYLIVQSFWIALYHMFKKKGFVTRKG